MSEKIAGLRKGERWWMAEVVLRALGITCLVGCFRLSLLAHTLIVSPPRHSPTAAEFLACAAIFLLLTGGLALLFEGPGLFRLVPVPPRSAFMRTAYYD